MDGKNDKCSKFVLKYRLHYKLMKQCFNPKCNVMKYNENAVVFGNYCLYPKQTIDILICFPSSFLGLNLDDEKQEEKAACRGQQNLQEAHAV